MKNVHSQFKLAVTAGLLALAGSANAGQVGSMNTFSAGSAAVAADVNANFTEQTTQINDNDTRITALETGDTNGLTIAELQGTYGAVWLETGELIRRGLDESGNSTIANPDNYFMSLLSTGSLEITFDAAGTATVHIIRFTEHEMGHYTGLDGNSNPAFDNSRTKTYSVCDVTTVGGSSANQSNGGPLEMCDTADTNATDNSGGVEDFTLNFAVIDPASRSIGADFTEDASVGEEIKFRGFVSLDGNVISLRLTDQFCGTSYDSGTDSCTGGKFVGRGTLTLVKTAN